MDKKEFNSNRELINEIAAGSGRMADNILHDVDNLVTDIQEYVKTIKGRDESLSKYMDLLSKFDYAEVMPSPIEMFPGIRTAAQMADPEKLRAQAEEMKEAAFAVKAAQEKNEAKATAVIRAIKNLFSLLGEYQAKEDQVYELSMSLLEKSDSIYDVGELIR